MNALNIFSVMLLQLAIEARPTTNPTLNPTTDSEGFLSFNSSEMTKPPGIFSNDTTGDLGVVIGKFKCETTRASPHREHVLAAAGRLNTEERCRQGNAGGSFCTELSSKGNAAVGVCGVSDYWLKCPEVAYAASLIADRCEWQGLAGGIVILEDKPVLEVIVYSN